MAKRRYEYAPAGTLPGLLQRGRGLGALMAAEDPTAAADLVYGCIRWDWRWDTQVDHRALYLARLLRGLELPRGPVVEVLAGDEDACMRATGVLELLALGGSAEARDALRDYVREGEHWVDVLESVADAWPAAWWDDLADTARARLQEGMEDPRPWALPWSSWGLARQAAERPAQEWDPLGDAASPDLLELLADPGEPNARKVGALNLLARREAEPGLVGLVPSLGTEDGRYALPLLRRAVEKLGALAVPAARDWAASGTPWLAQLGHDVLARHGEEQDIPVLLAELEQDWVGRTWCGPMYSARGLARFGPRAAEAASLLRRFWLWTPHSYERPAYLEALAAIGSAGMAEVYTECLWDCEADARLLAVRHAPDRPHVRERLACLRDDPMEEPEVRQAARVRLEGTAGARVDG
ncbi:hypothetical protein [Kitasatospora sp. MAA19]|uniref:hypothetical protein n=1 Tax=Kitasatospora sp. MAA19 TaxID=3035090 RepID=UPI0024732219|nr:hypothetical protein [Kitasatospora sp. MAA19]